MKLKLKAYGDARGSLVPFVPHEVKKAYHFSDDECVRYMELYRIIERLHFSDDEFDSSVLFGMVPFLYDYPLLEMLQLLKAYHLEMTLRSPRFRYEENSANRIMNLTSRFFIRQSLVFGVDNEIGTIETPEVPEAPFFVGTQQEDIFKELFEMRQTLHIPCGLTPDTDFVVGRIARTFGLTPKQAENNIQMWCGGIEILEPLYGMYRRAQSSGAACTIA